MPKQVYKLQRFDGGTNNHANSRDIADNEVVSIINGRVDTIGMITPLLYSTTNVFTADGGNPTSSAGARMTIEDTELINGDGLFVFSSDWRGGQIKTTGKHTASNDSANAVDASNRFIADELNGAYIYNLTNDKFGQIIDTADSGSAGMLITTLSGSEDFDTDDVYKVYAMSESTAVTESGDDYLCIPRQKASGGGIFIKSRNSGNSFAPIVEFNTNTNIIPKYYCVDGVLRVCDSAFTTNYVANNKNKWYGYINRTLFEGYSSTYQHIIDGWILQDSEPETPPVSCTLKSGSALSSLEVSYTDATDRDATPNADTGYTSPTNAIHSNDTGVSYSKATMEFTGNYVSSATVRVKITNFPLYEDWSVSAVVRIGQKNTTTTWQTGDTGYQYKSVYLEGFGFGGGIPEWNATDEVSFSWGSEFAINVNDVLVSLRVISSNASGATIAIDHITIVGGGGGVGDEVYNGQTDAVSIVIGDSATESTDYAAKWNVGVSYTYDGNQESLVRKLSDVDTGAKTVTLTKAPYMNIGFQYDRKWNQRITGVNVYMKKETDLEWLLHGVADLKSGEVFRLGDALKHSGAYSTANSGYLFSLSGDISTDLPVMTYDGNTGYSQETQSLTARYKTAVLANRRMYIGNVKIKDELGTERVFGDRIIKSPVNKFDIFPIENAIDATVNDGESITALIAFGDKLLEFKERTLYILNIAGVNDVLEATHHFRGVSHQGAVAKTEIGIVWANKHGCFFYNGNNIMNLLEKSAMRSISRDTWDGFFTDQSTVAYFPELRQIAVISSYNAGGSSGDAYIFDFITNSWVKALNFVSNTYAISNMINLWDGNIVWIEDGGANVSLKRKDLSIPTASLTSSTIAFVNSNPDTIVGTSYVDFITSGFKDGMEIIVTGSGEAGNNATFTIDTVVADTITLVATDALTAASAGSTITIKSGLPNFELITKEIDFGNPASKKDIYKVIATYKGGQNQNVDVVYSKDGGANYLGFAQDLNSVSTNQTELVLTPSASIRAIRSFQLKFTGTMANTFELNDLGIVYRERGGL